jgi:hypothetical protein
MRFEKGEEVVLLSESAVHDRYLIAHKMTVIGAKKSELVLPEGCEKVGQRWRAPIATLDEYALRLVFEWDWEQVKYSPTVKYKDAPKPVEKKKSTYAQGGYVPFGYAATDDHIWHTHYPEFGGYHISDHDHWAMKKPIPTEAQKAQKVCKNLKDFYGIETTIYKQTDPIEQSIEMVATIAGKKLQLKKILDPYMGFLPVLQDMGQEMTSMVKKAQKEIYADTAAQATESLKKLSDAGFGSMKMKDVFKHMQESQEAIYSKYDDNIDSLF